MTYGASVCFASFPSWTSAVRIRSPAFVQRSTGGHYSCQQRTLSTFPPIRSPTPMRQCVSPICCDSLRSVQALVQALGRPFRSLVAVRFAAHRQAAGQVTRATRRPRRAASDRCTCSSSIQARYAASPLVPFAGQRRPCSGACRTYGVGREHRASYRVRRVCRCVASRPRR